jgi:hypothetical protein
METKHHTLKLSLGKRGNEGRIKKKYPQTNLNENTTYQNL